MFCQYCGTNLEEDAKFCPNCGKTENATPPDSAEDYYLRGNAYYAKG
ncbi:MAG: zinc ribbon domain-containing protein, partial [Spirochaetaceae bacterium]|nr:zinc ribbon domain-containing protein [Spirochaetaceae bacterium]